MNPAAHLILSVIVHTDIFGHWTQKNKQFWELLIEKIYPKIKKYRIYSPSCHPKTHMTFILSWNTKGERMHFFQSFTINWHWSFKASETTQKHIKVDYTTEVIQQLWRHSNIIRLGTSNLDYICDTFIVLLYPFGSKQSNKRGEKKVQLHDQNWPVQTDLFLLSLSHMGFE